MAKKGSKSAKKIIKMNNLLSLEQVKEVQKEMDMYHKKSFK